MKVVYTAPNRGHHYKYASALNEAGYLQAFVSGFPRMSPHANAPELGDKLHHSDLLQTLYIASLKAKLPAKFSRWLAHMSKKEQDRACREYVRDCDIFLFYNGSGLSSSRYGKRYDVISIVEVVNSHVEFQEEILRKEYELLDLPWEPFPEDEKNRRLTEYREANYILLPSEFVKRSFIEKGFPENKLLKVPYGFNKSAGVKLVNKLESQYHPFTVLYVGSISVRKGIRYLIEAFNMTDNQNKKLVLVGPNTNDGSLNGLHISSDIVFTGPLKGEALENVYKSADVFCLPSIEEGLALVLGEAISYGLPIIATCNTGADDIMVDGKEGFIVPIRNSKAIADKLQILADSPTLLRQMRNDSYAKSREFNGWEDTKKALIEALDSIYLYK